MSTLSSAGGLGAVGAISRTDQNPELFVNADAVSIETETDATTNWTATGSTFSSQQSVVDGSTNAFLVETNTTPTSIGRCSFELNTILTDGVSYDLSIRARAHQTAGATGAWKIYLSSNGETANNFQIAGINDTLLTFATYTLTFTHDDTNTRKLVAIEANPENDGGLYLDKLSVRATVV